MQYTLNQNDKKHLVVNFSGRITFEDHMAFRTLLTDMEKIFPTTCVFNLSKVTYLDSAALGMLLLARDRLAKQSVSLGLKGATGQTEKVLALSNFSALFKME